MKQEARGKRQEERGKRQDFFLFLASCLLLLIHVSVSYAKENNAELLYNEARKDYYSLVNSKERQEKRSNWLNCIFKFESVYKKFPKSPVADKSLFTSARLYADLSKTSLNNADVEKSINLFEKIIKEYPQSSLADDAQYMIGEIYFRTENYPLAYSSYNAVINSHPSGDMVKPAKSKLSELLKVYQPEKQPPQSPLTNLSPKVLIGERELKGVVPSTDGESAQSDGLIEVKGIRYWSNPDYTRIVIDTGDKADYKEQRLSDPDRIFIDIHNSKLSPAAGEPIFINNGLLKDVRVGQNQKDVVRVVLDLDSIGSYSIIHLQNPFRIVIDVDGSLKGAGQGARGMGHGAKKEEQQSVAEKTESPPPQNNIRIVIDPGHGGKDSGAIGKRGLMEKAVVLDIAKRVRDIIKNKTGYEVILTRDSDVFIPLEERTVIANIKKADLFISIHANASRRRSAMGIETYFQGIPRTDEERETAARENMAAANDGLAPDDNLLEFILADMKNTHKINESSQLAGVIQDSLIKGVGSRYDDVKNLGVKQAMFYVLHKAKMPSILVETSFISNPDEERRFRDPKYREHIAQSIFSGIKSYIERTMLAYRTE
ncbi:MAG: N-acetylmuramoyl-L-alanine amidase [Nitrospinae bacterium]|nr:N-acetylmuramoyl-L-alanine amidase [Nitrospinota bacterium]